MEKKNTMLLTVIAVATLLVAVVGATFAYYSVTSENATTSTTNLGTTTQKVGTVSLTTANPSLYLHLNANQMADTESARGTYYHTTNPADFATKLATAPTATNVAKFETTGGEDDTNYYCTFNLTVTTTNQSQDSGESSAWAKLQNDDAKIVLSTSGANATFGNFTKTFTLNETKTANEQTELTVQFTGKTTAYIGAVASFDTAKRKQNDIAELNIKTEVLVNNLYCTTGTNGNH